MGLFKPQPKEFPPKPMIVRLIEPHGMKFHVKPIVASNGQAYGCSSN